MQLKKIHAYNKFLWPCSYVQRKEPLRRTHGPMWISPNESDGIWKGQLQGTLISYHAPNKSRETTLCYVILFFFLFYIHTSHIILLHAIPFQSFLIKTMIYTYIFFPRREKKKIIEFRFDNQNGFVYFAKINMFFWNIFFERK